MEERKELIEYRTPNSKHYLKKDGTIEVEIYDENIHYLTNNGYQDIDNTSKINTRAIVTGSESNTSVIDTYIYQGDTNVTTYNQDILKVGVEKVNNSNIVYRSLLKFELPTIPAGYKITDAKMLLYAYPDQSAPLNPQTPLASVHALTQDWSEQTAKWDNMNDKYDSRVEDYLYCSRTDINPSDWTFSIDPFNITKLVQEWYSGRPNYGVMIKQYQENYSEDVKIGTYVSKDYSTDNQPLKPKILITYKNYNGLENYLSYTSQNHFFGTSHISNYTGNLTTIFNVANTIGGPLPASLYLVYNTLDINEKKDYGYGLGIKPNLIQTIEKITIEETEMLKYLDEDGTTHYFYKETNDEEINKYHDEDGLELTIELVDNNYIMTDKDKNTNKFINHNGIYYLEEIKDTNNKAITIQYDSNNRINKVIDASNQEINITYETNKITFISPHLSTTISLTNNLLTSITSLNDTETITYNKYNLIEKIINPNNIALKYEYINDLSSKISKVSEISKEDNIGNYLTFNYELDNTTIIDNKNHINTYLFNQYGNVIGITNLDDNNLQNAYGKSYSFGTPETNDINKLLTDKSLIKYVDNIIDDSSFENEKDTFTCEGSITKSYTNDSRSGKKALKFTIDDDITTEPKIYNTFYVGGYDSVTLSFYAKGHGLTNLMLYTGTPISRDDLTIELTEEYKRYSITYDLKEAYSEKLNLVFNENYFTDMIIDDIQLEEGAVANYYNLIDNSSFDGLNNWNIYGAIPNETAEIINLTTNLNALKLHSEPQGSIQLNRRFSISGKAGDTFNLSFWYKCNGIIPTEGSSLYPGYWATIFFKYPNSEEYGACVPYRKLNIGNDNWQFFSENFTAEEDYEYLEITVNTFGGCNDLYLTNFSLFKDLESYSYVYDDEGNLVSSVDLSKETSQFAYNSNNQLIEATSPLGKKYKYEYDDNVTDRLIKAISPTGITNSIDYDENNNPIRTRINNTEAFADIEETNYYIRARGTNAYINIKPDKNLEILENTCSHDKFKIILLPNNRVKIQYTILNNYYLKDNNSILKLEYGDTNNIFELIKHQNNSYSIKSVTSNLAITVNTNNSLTLTTYNEDNSNQQFLFEKMDSKLFIESSASYSEDGRFINTVKDQLGNITTYNINNTNGLINSIIDPNNKITNYTYDNKFRITNITKENHSVSYEYNNDNNLSKIIHGTKNYIFNYDEFNNPSSVKINNNTLVNNYYENNNGNLNKVLYGNNQEINYTYDSLDRLESIIKSNDTYKNYYDNLGRITKITSNNDIYKYDYDFAKRLSTFKYNNYETNYNYDKENNVIEKIEELNNNKYTYNYEYNNESSLTKLSHNNQDFNYIYDILGRLEESNINNTYKTKYKYITYGNKTSTTIKEVDDNGIIYNYIYDKLGNITEIYKNNSLTNKYYYDTHSQLIKEDNILTNQTILYEYDNYGNILSKKVYTNNTLIKEDTYTYGDTNWQDLLTKYNNESITYDTIGNPTSIGNKTLTWMNERELSSYQDNTNNITYKYNLDGIRTSKIVNGIETKYYLEGSSIIFEDRNGNMIYYIYNGDELLGFIYNSNTYYYHKNIFGDIIGILDSNYNEVVTYTYNSWGLLTNKTDTTTINLSTINPFRYRSYYYDEETNLYYLNSRYYNPEWGRFVNADGYLSTGQSIIGLNMFCYCNNNSINYQDINGNFSLKSIGKKINEIKNKAKKVVNKVTSSAEKLKNKVKTSISNYNVIFSMFFKSVGANNDRSLSENEEKVLIDSFKNSNALNEIINTSLATRPKGTKTIIKSGSINNVSNENEVIKYVVGKYSYEIVGNEIRENVWEFNIKINDDYNFDEYRNWYNGIGAAANDFGYWWTNRGVIGSYKWDIEFSITKETIY